MPKFEATFRVIFKKEIDAPDFIVARKIADEMAKQVYQSDKDFVFVEFADLKQKEWK